ncbi:MAG: hypothetical protein ACYC7E_17475 [Armatimonadota bacterium]
MSHVRVVGFLLCGLLAISATFAAEPATPSPLNALSKACADACIRASFHTVGVPAFVDEATRAWGGEMGPTGRYLARQFATLLADAGKARFTVRDAVQLAKTMPATVLSLDDLASSASLRAAFSGVDGVALGTLVRDGMTLKIRVDLRRLRDGATVGTHQATLPLDADLIALLGANIQVTSGEDIYKVTSDAVLDTARASAEKTNPLLDPACPFRLEMLVGDKVKPLYRQNKDLFIAATVGETYALRITNNTEARVGVALFIDGLNVVRQQAGIPSQCPQIIVKPKSSVVVPGWLLDKGVSKAFLFTQRGQSVAGGKGLLGQIGLITASFFPEVPVTERRIWATPKPDGGDEKKRGLLGTGEGEDTGATVSKVSDCETTQFPAVILTLRYDDAATVEKYEKAQP